MKLAAFWCALAALVVPAQLPLGAQSAAPAYIAGPTPNPSGTTCPGESAAFPAIVAPSRVNISPASSANFRAHSAETHGNILIELRQDGQRAVIIPPTADIDAALRAALTDFARAITVKTPIPGCAHWASLIVVAFDPSDGSARLAQTSPPNPRTAAAARPSEVVGPTPDASGTACPGERDAGRELVRPSKIAITPASAAYFRAHNAEPDGTFILLLRLDGQTAIMLPARQDVDAALHAALLGYAKAITLRPPIEQCARPAAILTGQFSLSDGSVQLRQIPVSPGAQQSPTP